MVQRHWHASLVCRKPAQPKTGVFPKHPALSALRSYGRKAPAGDKAWRKTRNQRGTGQAGRAGMIPPVAILFARPDSIYKTLPGCDVWDIDRDARKWPGGCPVVAHPPCRAWGNLRHFSKPRPDEKELAVSAAAQVQIFGGVLEHPRRSTLWKACNLPAPNKSDALGRFTICLPQSWFGHKAEKMTLLYIVGLKPCDLPDIPFSIQEPSHVIGTSRNHRDRPEVTKSEREKNAGSLRKIPCRDCPP